MFDHDQPREDDAAEAQAPPGHESPGRAARDQEAPPHLSTPRVPSTLGDGPPENPAPLSGGIVEDELPAVSLVAAGPGSCDDLDVEAVLSEAAHTQRMVNLAQARQLFLAAHWADLHPYVRPYKGEKRGREELVQPGGDGTPGVAGFCFAELGGELGTATVTPHLLVADALDLRHRLPRIWARLESGQVRCWAARRIAARTHHLSKAAAGRVDEQMVDAVSRLTGDRLERALEAAVIAADEAAAREEAAQADAQQGVWVGRKAEKGYTTLVAKGPAPDLHRLDVSLDSLARMLTVLGDTDSHEVRRVKALALLADPEAVLDLVRQAGEMNAATIDPATLVGPHDGTDPANGADLGAAVLYVHVTGDSLAAAVEGKHAGAAPVRVQGLGPVLLDLVRRWLAHRHVTIKPVLDIGAMIAVDRYEFTPAMAEALRIVHPGDYFPYSPNITSHGDNEHPTPYVDMADGGPPGQTGMQNGAWTGRRNHNHKTWGGWTARQIHACAWLWRSPHARYYLVDHIGTTRLGKLDTPL